MNHDTNKEKRRINECYDVVIDVYEEDREGENDKVMVRGGGGRKQMFN